MSSLGRSFETRSLSTLAHSPRWSRDLARKANIIDVRERRNVRKRRERSGKKMSTQFGGGVEFKFPDIMHRQRCPTFVPRWGFGPVGPAVDLPPHGKITILSLPEGRSWPLSRWTMEGFIESYPPCSLQIHMRTRRETCCIMAGE